jgi:hypothetical protein
MDVAAVGLTPRSPTIAVVPVTEIPVFDRITKLPAVPRFTIAGDRDMAMAGNIKAPIDMAPRKRIHRLKTVVGFFVLLFMKFPLEFKTCIIAYKTPFITA